MVSATAAYVKEVKDMPKYMMLWRANLNAPWPIDPTEVMQLNEMIAAAANDASVRSGQILETGFFSNGVSGYTISSGEDAKGVFASAVANFPWLEIEVHEIVDYEMGAEIARQVMEAKAEQMAAMKR